MKRTINCIVRNMCKAIGVNYKESDCKKKGWYMKHSWTIKQENKFKEWMFKYLRNSPSARRDVMKHPTKNKEEIEKVIEGFLLNYGWKNKYENQKRI